MIDVESSNFESDDEKEAGDTSLFDEVAAARNKRKRRLPRLKMYKSPVKAKANETEQEAEKEAGS
jgi:hypothetical protein